MAPPLSLPTTARLPSSLHVNSSNPSVIKVLNRLSRPSLLSLVLDWLEPSNGSLCHPFLRENLSDDEDEDEFDNDLYPPASTLAELRELYVDMQTRKGSRREVVDRILEGDWREGLTLYQLAMADLQYLYDHPGTLKWACYKIQRLKTPRHEDDVEADRNYDTIDKLAMHVPRFHPSTFLQNLQAEVLPDVKAHYNFDRPKGLPLLLLRIFVLDSPYNTDLAVSATSGSTSSGARTVTSFDASRTIYVAFPDASPHIFVSKSQSAGPTTHAETRSLRALVVEGIPKALSRPRERYSLKTTNLQTKNLDAMLSLRGSGRSNAAAGGWSVYAGDKAADARTHSPLNSLLPTPPLSDDAAGEDEEQTVGFGNGKPNTLKRTFDSELSEEENRRKRTRLVAQARFGDNAKMDDGKGIERVDILIEDPFPVSELDFENESDGQDVGELNSSHPRKPKGRRSSLDASLLEEAEGDEDEDSELQRQDYDRDRGASENVPRVMGRRAREGDRGREKWAWRPNVRLSLHGPHVFAGIRQLVEAGFIDGERMPGWMTGEDGVTRGAVRNGRVKGFKGSGL
ncbi:centromere protein Chl4/mis15/CENP-N [Xylaria bambusicola]|uniref:centromere protein Chl4/mis15/CENP-N n=1 Tax=Xylaria bambusicola TaxID=326684 RepID=UPI0020073121|nr:centromere protein Chl4/mis15/CENP-N [Xylaria bambusicola]KAI0518365.1 centromere protein Chl4/mis15/CENP-N [Xylaria bambusicola]